MLCVALALLPSALMANEPLADASWVEVSYARALPVLELVARYNPEAAGRYGLDEYDEAILDLLPQVYERNRADTRRVLDRLESKLADEQHPKVKQDMQILIQVLN